VTPRLAAVLPQRFAAALAAHRRPSRYWVAYSGGLDSHVLLHLAGQLARSDPGFPELRAVHVHHGLLPQAEQWTGHCAEVCRGLAISLQILRVDGRTAAGESPEAAARAARYGAWRALLAPGEVLLTAQHQGDQAETLLLQLLRGAGVEGLAAMAAWSPCGDGHLLRPLLEVGRSDLLEYAEAVPLLWVEDPSNRDLRYDRNFLRNAVIPLLKQRWPGLDRVLSRSARHCAEAQACLQQCTEELYAAVGRADGGLSVAGLRGCAEPDRNLLLRRWIRATGLRPPSARVLRRVAAEMLSAGPDRSPRVAWCDGSIRRYRDGLYLQPATVEKTFDRGRVIP